MHRLNQNIVTAGELNPIFNPEHPFLIEECMVMLCTSGCATFMLNFEKHIFTKGNALFLFNDMIFVPESYSDDFKIKYVSISSERVMETVLLIASTHFWDDIYMWPVKRLHENIAQAFNQWID